MSWLVQEADPDAIVNPVAAAGAPLTVGKKVSSDQGESAVPSNHVPGNHVIVNDVVLVIVIGSVRGVLDILLGALGAKSTPVHIMHAGPLPGIVKTPAV